MRKILVTGGAGFVGSALALAFKAGGENVSVTALDNLRRRGSELNLPRLAAGGVAFAHGDVRSPGDLEACGPVDLVVECSAEPSVLAGYDGSPDYVLDTNLTGAVRCLEHARRHGAAMLFLSTSRVYPVARLNQISLSEGETRFEAAAEQTLPGVSPDGVTTAFPLDGARSLYGATKLCAELLIAEYADMYGLPAVVNRCGVIAGPWQMGRVDQGVAGLWAARHVYGGNLAYIGYGGAGKQVRDMLHVDDLVRLALLQSENPGRWAGEVFNAGGGPGSCASLLELTGLCREATGNSIPVGSVPETRAADVPWYVTDNAEITAATGWRPEKGVADIVGDLCRWITDHRDALAGILA